jgi:hypothetical protein
VPCFPSSVEARGPLYSVADSLRHLGFNNAPVPDRPPTMNEMSPYRSGPVSPVVNLLKIDPFCAVKSILKSVRGKNDVYYLYRVWDHLGEHPVLRESPFDPASFQGIPEFHFELLGRFDDECKAIAAYRHSLRMAPSQRGPTPSQENPQKDTPPP